MDTHTTNYQNTIPLQPPGSANIINFCAINVNSLGANKCKYDLYDFVVKNNIDVTLISETKLNNRQEPIFNNYALIRNDRPNAKNGGGTAILINKRISYTIITHRNSRTNKVIEFTAIKIHIHANVTLLIICIYATCNKKTLLSKNYQNCSRTLS